MGSLNRRGQSPFGDRSTSFPLLIKLKMEKRRTNHLPSLKKFLRIKFWLSGFSVLLLDFVWVYQQIACTAIKLRLVPLSPILSYRSTILPQFFHGDLADQITISFFSWRDSRWRGRFGTCPFENRKSFFLTGIFDCRTIQALNNFLPLHSPKKIVLKIPQ